MTSRSHGTAAGLCLAAVLAVSPTTVAGQAASAAPGADAAVAASGPLAGRPAVSPSRTSTPPVIDGRLDDEVWRRATRLTRFVQQAPLEGAPASEDTDVYIAYDAEHLYFGFHAHYEDPSVMRANRVERDRAFSDDLMTVYFDTFMDQTRGYDFDVNGYGVQGDGIISRTGEGGAIPRADRTWNALFESAGVIVEDGFTAEMAIPFKSLRYPRPADGEAHRWGFQIVREIKGKDEENVVWAPMSRDESSFFAQMGVLEGMTGISTSRNVEVLPTFTAIQFGDIDPTRPAFVNRDPDPDAGVNLKYGITSNLTADATLNPDFSQIESDRAQIEVNQRFPLFFPELRPFFLEGAEIFDILSPITLIHTRTIVDPDWGAKLTGKVGSFSVGALAANDRAPGKVDDPGDPAFGRSSRTVIGRALYDVYSESTIGAVLTDRQFMDGHSRLFGLDATLRLSPTIVFNAQAIGTRHRSPGLEERRGHVVGTRTVRDGRSVDWEVNVFEISPELETDVGFIRRRDVRHLSSAVGYRFWPEARVIDWGPRVRYERITDFDGVVQDEGFEGSLDFRFAGNVTASGSLNREVERFGGVDFRKTRWSVRTRANTSRAVSLGGNLSAGDQVRYGAEPFLGNGVSWGVNATVRPTSRVQVQLDLDASRLTDPRAGGSEVFDVKILRARGDVQLSDRLGVRHIAEVNSLDETLALNLLLNYRVNAGTVFYLGYDDHHQSADLIELDRDGDGIDDRIFYTDGLRRTRRAFFVKLQYLLRY